MVGRVPHGRLVIPHKDNRVEPQDTQAKVHFSRRQFWIEWNRDGAACRRNDGKNGFGSARERNAYPRLKVPAAILWGDKDSITPLDQAHDLQKLMPEAALTVLPGLGHIPQIEDPEAFNAALLTALGKL